MLYSARPVIKELGLEFPVISDEDGKVCKLFKVYDKGKGKAKTATVIIDQEGKIAWKYVGTSSADHPSADDIIRVLSGI